MEFEFYFLNLEAELAKLTAFPTRIPIEIIEEFRGHLLFGKNFIKNYAERYDLSYRQKLMTSEFIRKTTRIF